MTEADIQQFENMLSPRSRESMSVIGELAILDDKKDKQDDFLAAANDEPEGALELWMQLTVSKGDSSVVDAVRFLGMREAAKYYLTRRMHLLEARAVRAGAKPFLPRPDPLQGLKEVVAQAEEKLRRARGDKPIPPARVVKRR